MYPGDLEGKKDPTNYLKISTEDNYKKILLIG